MFDHGVCKRYRSASMAWPISMSLFFSVSSCLATVVNAQQQGLTSTTMAHATGPSTGSTVSPSSGGSGSATTDESSASSSAAPSSSSGYSSHGAVNHIFLVIAGLFVFILLLLYSSHRRRIRAETHTQGHVAPARDIEGWGRAGLPYGGGRVTTRARGPGLGGSVWRRDDVVEHDELGGVPPSYEHAAADKPPSLRYVHRETERENEERTARAIELSMLDAQGNMPPRYEHAPANGNAIGSEERLEDVDTGDVRRPEAAVMTTTWRGVLSLESSNRTPASEPAPAPSTEVTNNDDATPAVVQ